LPGSHIAQEGCAQLLYFDYSEAYLPDADCPRWHVGNGAFMPLRAKGEHLEQLSPPTPAGLETFVAIFLQQEKLVSR